MADYEEKLLTMLAEKYRKSKKDAKTNVIARRTRVRPSELYKNYSHNDGDMDKIQGIRQAAKECQKKGFVTFEEDGFSSEIRAIYLVDEKIEEVERYLEKQYGYESKGSKKAYLERLIAAYGKSTPAAQKECERLRRVLLENRIPPKYREEEDLLKALVFIERNEQDLFLREASSMIYGDSKYLEEVMLSRVCKVLRDFLGKPCEEDELEDEILLPYHIRRDRQKLCLKGNVSLRINGKIQNLGEFRWGMEFFADELERVEKVVVRGTEWITVENYTSWLRLEKPEAAIFYLGGYASRSQREFLKKVYKDNPQIQYRHFGDIDAGGLYIHEHLCRVTGIPFQMYRMSVEELENPRFQPCLHPLTVQDRKRLKSLEQQERYRELAQYMLEKNVKLEQEIVSLWMK